eukprot:scaffold19959_cov20-Tisochrysis_lutea.AAC.5
MVHTPDSACFVSFCPFPHHPDSINNGTLLALSSTGCSIAISLAGCSITGGMTGYLVGFAGIGWSKTALSFAQSAELQSQDPRASISATMQAFSYG